MVNVETASSVAQIQSKISVTKICLDCEDFSTIASVEKEGNKIILAMIDMTLTVSSALAVKSMAVGSSYSS